MAAEVITNTIYDKRIRKFTANDIIANAVPSIDSGANTSNIMLMQEVDGLDPFIIMDRDDALDFVNTLMQARKTIDILPMVFDTILGTGVKTSYSIDIQKKDDIVEVYAESGDQHSIIYIPLDILKVVCFNIRDATDQAFEMLECNRRLEKWMTKIRDDMKAELVHSVYWDIVDEHPKIYAENENGAIATYSITARDKDEKPLYTFLRIMHLTCVPIVDYKQYGKDFLGCPFVFSDKMIERGKSFVERKKGELHDYVDNKIKKGQKGGK